jgi:hypothetical protein
MLAARRSGDTYCGRTQEYLLSSGPLSAAIPVRYSLINQNKGVNVQLSQTKREGLSATFI